MPPRPPLRATPVVGALVRAYEERLTARGRYLLWVTAAFALIGLDTRRSQAHLAFAAGAAALLLGALLTLYRRPRLALSWEPPRRATAGRALRIPARVDPLAGAACPGVRLSVPRPLRWGGSLRFLPAEQLVDVPAAGLAVELELLPLRRGCYVVRGLAAQASDPLGLTAGPPTALPDRPLVVYPPFWAIEDFAVPTGRRYQPGGIPLSSSTGDAIEFVGTREYREGDPPRNIHWRSWARRGQPVVREYQEEYFSRIALVVDTYLPARPSRADERGFEAALSAAASVADFFTRSEYVVDILAAGPEVYEVSAGRSLAYLENVLDVLASLEPSREAPFAGIGPTLFERLQRLTTVVAVLQDWDAPRVDFLRRVHALGTAVRALVVRDGPPTLDPASDAEIGEIGALTALEVERLLAREPGRG